MNIPRLKNGWHGIDHKPEEPYQPPSSESLRVMSLEDLLGEGIGIGVNGDWGQPKDWGQP